MYGVKVLNKIMLGLSKESDWYTLTISNGLNNRNFRVPNKEFAQYWNKIINLFLIITTFRKVLEISKKNIHWFLYNVSYIISMFRNIIGTGKVLEPRERCLSTNTRLWFLHSMLTPFATDFICLLIICVCNTLRVKNVFLTFPPFLEYPSLSLSLSLSLLYLLYY